jgi:2'-5' RNA ligase
MARGRPKFQKERPPDQHAVGTDWRLFVAVPMPGHVRAVVQLVTEQLGAHDWPVRWVASESAHLTLHFLGDTAPERAELLRLGLAQAVARFRPFRLHLTVPGVFPDFRRPRVLWVGLGGETEQLIALAGAVGGALSALDIEIDHRPLHPHITLGRVRDEAPSSLGASVEQAYRAPEIAAALGNSSIAFDVEEVQLVRSFLERSGARHEPLARYPLRRS